MVLHFSNPLLSPIYRLYTQVVGFCPTLWIFFPDQRKILIIFFPVATENNLRCSKPAVKTAQQCEYLRFLEFDRTLSQREIMLMSFYLGKNSRRELIPLLFEYSYRF